jgi:hypothetical protein
MHDFLGYSCIKCHVGTQVPCSQLTLSASLALSQAYYPCGCPNILFGFDPKDLIQCLYCEPKNMKLSIVYTLSRDFNDGDFVFVNNHDLGLFRLLWEEHKVML